MPPVAKKAKNPFYALVLIVGIGFLLTACAYTVLAFLDVRGHGDTAAQSGLLTFLNEHGITLFGVELAALCMAMLAAFATEDFWQRRFDQRHGHCHAAADTDPEGPVDSAAGASSTSQGRHVV